MKLGVGRGVEMRLLYLAKWKMLSIRNFGR